VDFFCSEVEPLPWVEPELLFFCLELEEPLPDLLSDLLESDFVQTCFQKILEVRFHGRVLLFIPSIMHNSLDEFSESCKGVWLIVVDHIIFDTFGKSIVACLWSAAFPHPTCAASCWNLIKYFIAWWLSSM